MTVYRAAVWARDAVDSPTCQLSMLARLMLLYLASRADTDGTCFVTNDTLRQAMGLGEKYGDRNVRRARAELVAAGLIGFDVGGGRGLANTYRFPFVEHPAEQRNRPPLNPGSPARINGNETRAHQPGKLVHNGGSAARDFRPQPGPTSPGLIPNPDRNVAKPGLKRARNPGSPALPSRREVVDTEVARLAPLPNGDTDQPRHHPDLELVTPTDDGFEDEYQRGLTEIAERWQWAQ